MYSQGISLYLDWGEDSAAVNKIKQNVYALEENQLLQQAYIQEQHDLLNLTRLETAENYKLKKPQKNLRYLIYITFFDEDDI